MKLFQRRTTEAVIFALIVFCVMFINAPAASYASSFMDLELSIKELQQLVEKTNPSLAMVVSYDDCGVETSRGSGFFIDRGGTIIINASLVRGAYSAEVLSRTGRYDNVKIIHRDDSLDIALIQVRAANEKPLELAYDYAAAPGERVVVVGKTPDFNTTVSEGLIVSFQDKSKLMEIQTTKPLLAFKESKDGPLLNMSGKVIGIMSAGIPGGQQTDGIARMPDYQNFHAGHISAVKEFVSRPQIAEQLHPAKSKIWSRWIMRGIQNAAISTFIILYSVGFPKLIVIAFMIVMFISAIQWLYIKLKRKI